MNADLCHEIATGKGNNIFFIIKEVEIKMYLHLNYFFLLYTWLA